jgi:hypothetical protein
MAVAINRRSPIGRDIGNERCSQPRVIRREVGRVATRDELLAVLRMVTDRFGNFEALMEARFDQSLARMSNPGGA